MTKAVASQLLFIDVHQQLPPSVSGVKRFFHQGNTATERTEGEVRGSEKKRGFKIHGSEYLLPPSASFNHGFPADSEKRRHLEVLSWYRHVTTLLLCDDFWTSLESHPPV